MLGFLKYIDKYFYVSFQQYSPLFYTDSSIGEDSNKCPVPFNRLNINITMQEVIAKLSYILYLFISDVCENTFRLFEIDRK